MLPLPSEERRALLELARRAIVEAVSCGGVADVATAPTEQISPEGLFVTLHRQGRLRGCIGQVGHCDLLTSTVMRCAVAAALEDPRFPPVRIEELAELEIEISILTTPEPILPHAIEVGRHGLVVSQAGRRGLLLPQVAVEHRWTCECFLEETCIKAGLERDAWRDPATQVMAFTAEVFSEAEFRAQPENAPASLPDSKNKRVHPFHISE